MEIPLQSQGNIQNKNLEPIQQLDLTEIPSQSSGNIQNEGKIFFVY